MVTTPDELEDLLSRSVQPIADELLELAKARAAFIDERAAAATRRLASLIAGSMGLADLLGRRRFRAHAAHLARKAFAAPRGPNPVMPQVTFLEAVEAIIDRTPSLQPSWRDVSRVYTQEFGFAMARSFDLNITKRVQAYVADAIARGEPVDTASERIRAIGEDMPGFTRAYAETVYRTNVASAYAAGRWREAADPDLADVIGGFRFSTAGDSDVRDMHHRLDGIVAATDDPIWDRIAPPRGYNCRCDLELVSPDEMRELGLADANGRARRAKLPVGWKADQGFELAERPDKRFYGA